ncbi:MAG: dihydroneopterin aldolase [Candidatus Bipolaricaulota bacterium]|nr:dihydroneopterin aldolase [Candidatus Bipolaricaulota bacterium]MBS3792217.1 dihydroneopterin aldolase [Candidatus Bipolaricaulota bacterium]
MDRIKINDLSIRTIIGTEDYERESKQEVIVNVTLFTDVSVAGSADELERTVDYSKVKNEIYEMAVNSEFKLIESLAEEIARIALAEDGVARTKVSVQKPSALRFTRSAEVEIVREI